jgi:hypothetical protein
MSEPDSSDIDISEEELSDDSSTVIVTDSENYGRTQKLKHIYRAKEQVQELRRNSEELVKEYNEYWRGTHGREVYNRELASSVAEYGSELLPVIEQAKGDDQLELHHTITKSFKIQIEEFVRTDGMEVGSDPEEATPYSPTKTLDVYRQLNRILRELGLGLDLEEEKGPAEI